MKTAVLITCHNRNATTLNCLSRLAGQLHKGDKVFLLDDGSTDGTTVAVTRDFSDVCIVSGDGSIFGAKGMRKAWEAAVAERQDWDGYLWLNDDTKLRLDAIAKILAANNGEKIVIGELENVKGEIGYGTRPGGLFTGNCVLVPRKVYDQLGMICGDYSHAWADSDYAMQAKRSGVEVVSAGVVGLVLTMADVARHSKCENGSRQFIRKYLREVIFDGKVPLRLKAKASFAAIGI